MQDVKERVTEILCECTGRKVNDLDFSANPMEYLEMDSVIIMDFILNLEDAFGIEFENFSELSLHMDTIGEMLDFICEAISGGASD